MILDPASDNQQTLLAPRLVDALYGEALQLAAAARSYFDGNGKLERDRLEPLARVTFACEALQVTTRIMHVVAWLLTVRAGGGLDVVGGSTDAAGGRLGDAGRSDPATILRMPEQARGLIVASSELYDRAKRIDCAPEPDASWPSPARALMGRLERDFAVTA